MSKFLQISLRDLSTLARDVVMHLISEALAELTSPVHSLERECKSVIILKFADSKTALYGFQVLLENFGCFLSGSLIK